MGDERCPICKGNFADCHHSRGDLREHAERATMRKIANEAIESAASDRAKLRALAGVSDPAALLAVFDEMRAALELTEEALDMFVIAARMGGADEDDGDNHALEVARAALARAAAVRGGR